MLNTLNNMKKSLKFFLVGFTICISGLLYLDSFISALHWYDCIPCVIGQSLMIHAIYLIKDNK